MTPAAKQMVDQLRRAPGWEIFKPGDSRYFRKADEELVQFCQGPYGDLSLVSEWADAWRERHRETAPFHFVNTPFTGDGSQASIASACGANCILTELDKQIVILDDKKADPGLRMQALLWVVHLVGDVHQPLHCADNGDRGGNTVGVFVGGRVENLHSAWDTEFFYVEHARPAELAVDLLAHECKDVPVEVNVKPDSPWAWAAES
ncbi:MAG TPA: S1/P1 nuclease, partial [bacterium]|nr:S1/P1 nuclease [bacterium]